MPWSLVGQGRVQKDNQLVESKGGFRSFKPLCQKPDKTSNRNFYWPGNPKRGNFRLLDHTKTFKLQINDSIPLYSRYNSPNAEIR